MSLDSRLLIWATQFRAASARMDPVMDNSKPSNLPLAFRGAQEYIAHLRQSGVPYSITPDCCEKSGKRIGINVGVDASYNEEWSKWVVLNFRESGLNSLGYTTQHTMIEEFSAKASISMGALAENLSQCIAGKKSFEVVTKDGDFKILQFKGRYSF